LTEFSLLVPEKLITPHNLYFFQGQWARRPDEPELVHQVHLIEDQIPEERVSSYADHAPDEKYQVPSTGIIRVCSFFS
jgi:hypothetical protein